MSERVQWIPVSDRLPDDELTVLVFMPHASEQVWLGFYADGNWRCADGFYMAHPVTHWAEMPEGPQ